MRETGGPGIRLKPDSTAPSIRLKPDSTGIRLKPDSTFEEPALFTATIEEPRRRSGLSVWFAAAGSLVLGIVIGFASGYRIGQGLPGVTTAESAATPAPTTGGSGQPFSESAVSEPVALDPDPGVAPMDDAAGPRQEPQAAAAETPAGPRRGSPTAARPALPSPVGRVPPRSAAPAADPASTRTSAVDPASAPAPPPTGPGSLQVLSRPAGAQVFLDGKAVGRTPLVISEVVAGPHNVRLELPGFNRWATTVDVQAGVPIRVAASLEQ